MNDDIAPLRKSNTVIDIRNVSMAYKLYNKPIDLLKEVVFGGARHDTFWALRDISLSVLRGERLGIVGPNGAGKSTLLQVIAGNLKPTSGSVAVNGRISSLLSLVPAWNLEESGLENIKFNLLVQGVDPKVIPVLVDDIVDFTELGPFIFHPVKTYSSGMSARLAFAIATATEPEILMIDEVLGTGDGYFAGKAHRRMQEFCARGKALLFVSHATSAVQQMCDKVVWIHNGSIRLIGDAEYVLTRYETDFRDAEDEAMRAKQMAAAAQRAGAVMPGEVPDEGYLRFRIVADKTTFFGAAHYIGAIRIEGFGDEPIEVPLELTDTGAKSAGAALDIWGSEWGRVFHRTGNVSRLLARTTGRRPGGHFLIKVPEALSQTTLDIGVEILSSTTDSRENLTIEVLDMRTGSWRALPCATRGSRGGHWRVARFAGTVTISRERVAEVIDTITKNALPSAEITRVDVMSKGEKVVTVREREPFEVCVETLFRKEPEIADVIIKLNRSDGVHVFWQSSGLEGLNLRFPNGKKLVKFRFDPNDLAAGEYHITCHIANGWSYPENFPYSEILARAINVTAFKILRQFSEVDFGVLNRRIPVEVITIDDPTADERPEAATKPGIDADDEAADERYLRI